MWRNAVDPFLPGGEFAGQVKIARSWVHLWFGAAVILLAHTTAADSFGFPFLRGNWAQSAAASYGVMLWVLIWRQRPWMHITAATWGLFVCLARAGSFFDLIGRPVGFCDSACRAGNGAFFAGLGLLLFIYHFAQIADDG